LTSIVVDVPVGGTTVQVADLTGFAVGNMVKLSGGLGTEENVEILSIDIASKTLTLKVATTNAHTTGNSVLYMNAFWFTGSDPVVRIGERKIKFWLPLHSPVPLLKTKYLNLMGSVFPGPRADLQWFGTFWITVPDGRDVVKVSIKRGLHLNSTAGKPTLDVKAFGRPVNLEELPPRGRDFVVTDDGHDLRFHIGREAHHPPRVRDPTFEYIFVQTPDLVFAITTAHAAVDFPTSPRLALQHAHLDLFVTEMSSPHRFQGMLPQLWGAIPMTAEVEAMTVSPDPLANTTQVCSSGSPGRGGKRCQDPSSFTQYSKRFREASIV
jgi:hypothetical protein